MNKRSWVLAGVFAVLGLVYVTFFTEWVRPEPIQIASQVRAVIHPPRFGRPASSGKMTNLISMKVDALIKGDEITRARANDKANTNQATRTVDVPDWGKVDQSPGGVANVTFSFDGRYVLTAIRVEDQPADGAAPKVVWNLLGKSPPTSTLLYGRDPQGMKAATPSAKAEPLVAGVPYRLIVEAGRRRGTNSFKTMPFVVR